MSGPNWLSWPLAGLMVISALYHAVRLLAAGRRGRTNGYDVDLAHLVMCAAMAAMLVMTVDATFATACAVALGVPTVWFVHRALGALLSDGTRGMIWPVQQLLMCAAMLFMLVVPGGAVSAPTSMATAGMNMPGMTVQGQVSHEMVGSTSLVALTSLIFVGLLAVVAAQHARRLRAAATAHVAWPLYAGLDGPRNPGGLLLAPGLSLGSQVAMSGTMIYMLILLA
jgi:hypothetical protein